MGYKNPKQIHCTIGVLLLAGSVSAGLRFGAICPEPSTRDPNGCVSGWVELVNDGAEAENLADYELVRKNRGKKADAGKQTKNLLSRVLNPGASTRVYLSEAYANCEDRGGDGKVALYDNDAMVFPEKLSVKKFQLLQLYRGASAADKVLVDEAVVPVDLVAGLRYDAHTREIINGVSRIACGPQVGPRYGVKHDFSDFDPPAMAVAGQDYPVTLDVNPALPNLAGASDQIRSVTLLYVADFGTVRELPMTCAATIDSKHGWRWTATVPASQLPAPGGLLRWAARIETADLRTWRSPAFHDPDDGYEWYGTIVTPNANQCSASLQTLHLFVTGSSLSQMDVDINSQNRSLVPYGARCGIFDQQTGHYYDNVRIELRGHTTAGFAKKSHGLRFSKCHPMRCTETVFGTPIECRKSSLVAEYCDPVYLRQGLSFWACRQAGLFAPFHYAVRVQLNGSFFQMDFHSERFTDELLEDFYGLDPEGYGYKNAGSLWPDLRNAITIEKKLPDDGDETSSTAYAPLKAWTANFSGVAALSEGHPAEVPSVTRAVTCTMDLPQWFNYLAQTRITQETDDVWANLSVYWDRNGSGLWIPLGYDMGQTWGNFYWSHWGSTRSGAQAENDAHKSHPFYGGIIIQAHTSSGANQFYGNCAFEAVFQHAKYRRQYLRRLRTMIDEQLGEPGTPKEATLCWTGYVVRAWTQLRADALDDYDRWRAHKSTLPQSGTFWTESTTFSWPGKITPDEGLQDLWDNYIVPRRRHFYVTHSITNTAKTIGYGASYNAGIPLAQPPTRDLRAKFAIVNPTSAGGFDAASGVLVITNGNDIAVDMSGWQLTGGVDWVLPKGAVVDAHDVIYVVRDRKDYVARHSSTLFDETIVGNARFNEGCDWVALGDVSGAGVCAVVAPEVRVDAGMDFTNLTVRVSVANAAAKSGTAPDAYQVSVVAVREDGSERAVVAATGDDGTVDFTFAANPGENLRWRVEVTLAGKSCGVTPVEGMQVAANTSRWFDAKVAKDGVWSPDECFGRYYVPKREQPAGVVAVDATVRVSGSVPVAQLPCVTNALGETIARGGLAVADNAWWGVGTRGWERLGSAPAPVYNRELALRIVYDSGRGEATYYLDGANLGTLSYPVRKGEIGRLQVGGGDLREFTGQGQDANVASVDGVEFATMDAALSQAQAHGGTVKVLWNATVANPRLGVELDLNGHSLALPPDWAVVTRNGVSRFGHFGTRLLLR